MSEKMDEETEKALIKVAKIISTKYFLPDYDTVDIFQEAYLIGLQTLKKYSQDRGPVENFLNVAVNNAFKNFIRSKTVSPKPCGCIDGQTCSKCRYRESKARVLHMKQLGENTDAEDNLNKHREILEELYPIIDIRLPVSMREDWRRIREDVHVVRSRRNEVLQEVRTIIEDYEAELEENNPIIQELPSYEYGWEAGYFYIESDQHLVKIYMDEEASKVWLSILSPVARQIYLKLKNAVEVDSEEVAILAASVNSTNNWDV